jgi:hypothetical protein
MSYKTFQNVNVSASLGLSPRPRLNTINMKLVLRNVTRHMDKGLSLA